MTLALVEQASALRVINEELLGCCRCPRLVAHREHIARVQRRAYRGQHYWSRPVLGFGDPFARLLIIGLAPGAHGANRTGRMFTGDRSGEFLYRALYESGFANQPVSISREDGLALTGAYITSPVHCVPPGNKPDRDEILACRTYLLREIEQLKSVEVVVVLGRIALDAYLSILQDSGKIKSRSPFPFSHGAAFGTHSTGPVLIASFHPSQQNTSTKRLTAPMLLDVFLHARDLLKWGLSEAQQTLLINRP